MIRVGIIGAGFMGNMHFNVYRHLPGVEVVAVVDIIREKAQELAEETGAEVFTDFDEMLGNIALDVIDITLPTHLHCEYVVKAAEAGKDVVCEKPMALSLNEADAMIEATSEHGVKFMVAHCIRFWPEYQMLLEFCREDAFGGLENLKMSRVGPLPDWSGDSWFMDPEKSGGMVLDLHIHDTDFILYLLGRPQAVHAVGTQNKYGLSHIFTNYTYSKTAVSAEGGWVGAEIPFSMSFRASFSDAVLEYVSGRDPSLLLYRKDREKEALTVPESGPGKAESGGNISELAGYYNELHYFIECVKHDREPEIVTPQKARESLAVVLAEAESVESGKVIPV